MIHKHKEGYPLYVKGNIKIFDYLKLVLSTTISIPKPISICVQFQSKYKQITPLLQPMINLQIIDDIIRQQIIKNKYQLKSEIFYIYFPSEFRVDQKIYKSLLKNYQNLLDQIPRNIKPNISKLIIWQQGRQQHSIDTQKYKINELLSQFAKIQIQQKLLSLTTQIKQYQSQQTTIKSLLHIFLLKNKLAKLYTYLNVNDFACDLLCDIWNQIMINYRCLMKLGPRYKTAFPQKLQVPEDIPKVPYTFQNINDVLGYFQNTLTTNTTNNTTNNTLNTNTSTNTSLNSSSSSNTNTSTAYLRIVTHAFLNYYTFTLDHKIYYQGISKLKIFLDFILNNVLVPTKRPQWNKQQYMLFDIARNLWVVEIITKSIQLMKLSYKYQLVNNSKIINNINNNTNNINNINNWQQYNKIYVSICSMLRNSVQRIGFILYNFNNYSIFPNSIQQQIQFIHNKIIYIKQPWKKYKLSIESINQDDINIKQRKNSSMSIHMRRQTKQYSIAEVGPKQLKLKQLISQKLKPTIQIYKLLSSFSTYNQIYLQVLTEMDQALKNSTYGRVARSLKITLERATILLGDWQNYQQFPDQQQQFCNIWPDFQAVQKLYRLFFLFIKYLSGQQVQQIIRKQLLKVIIDNNLKYQDGRIFNIVNTINQIIQNQNNNKTLKLSQLYSFILSSNHQIKITIKCINKIEQSGLTQLFKKCYNLSLITKQVMLNQGIKKYNLLNIKIRQYKICQNCKDQCLHYCLENGELFIQIIGQIQLQDKNQQSTFYIEQIQLSKKIKQKQKDKQQQKQKQLIFSLVIPKNIGKILYQINTPKIVLLQEDKDIIFSQVWTPYVFQLSHFVQQAILCGISANIIREFQEEEQRDNIKLNNQIKQDTKLNTDISPDCYIHISKNYCREVKNFNDNKNYHKLNTPLSIKLQKSQKQQQQSKCYITIFIKSHKPSTKIKRNSQRKQQQCPTNQKLNITITLKSSKLNKQYKLQSNTKSLIIYSLLKIQYHAVQTCQQFIITNLHDLPIQIQQISYQNKQYKQNRNRKQSYSSPSQSIYLLNNLYKDEQLNLLSRLILISPLLYINMKIQVNFNDWFDSQHLIQQKSNTFKIWYKIQYNYLCFKPIQIQSQIIGSISIPDLQQVDTQGYQLIGKINGDIQYINKYRNQIQRQKIGDRQDKQQQKGRSMDSIMSNNSMNSIEDNKSINLWLVPIRCGNIVLPQIWINGKRGIWINSLITDIK